VVPVGKLAYDFISFELDCLGLELCFVVGHVRRLHPKLESVNFILIYFRGVSGGGLNPAAWLGYLKIRYPANITADDPATNDWISGANPSAKEYTK
jgi:hypothetical protein